MTSTNQIFDFFCLSGIALELLFRQVKHLQTFPDGFRRDIDAGPHGIGMSLEKSGAMILVHALNKFGLVVRNVI